jgi:beta-N-acetylhexosaminidase
MSRGPVLIGVESEVLGPECQKHLRHPAVGGVVLFTRNFRDREQLGRLIESIRDCRQEPLLIAVDQEGGRVQRFRDSFTQLPPLGQIGALISSDSDYAIDMAYRHGRVMAVEMLACGVDLSFAPVLDLDRGSSVIGDRAFSGNPATVIQLGKAYIAGMHDAGMKTTGKHFPGHGSVVADSHLDDVDDDRGIDEIRESDLQPFIELHDQLDALMIAHVVYSRVDAVPAGYSETWLKQILRDEIGYTGVIISDDLGMHAAKSVGTLQERTRLCLEAGCELVLVCQPEDVATLMAQLDDGNVSLESDDAAAAINRLAGAPTLTGTELEAVAQAGIREWPQWQRSLEQLGNSNS